MRKPVFLHGVVRDPGASTNENSSFATYNLQDLTTLVRHGCRHEKKDPRIDPLRQNSWVSYPALHEYYFAVRYLEITFRGNHFTILHDTSCSSSSH